MLLHIEQIHLHPPMRPRRTTQHPPLSGCTVRMALAKVCPWRTKEGLAMSLPYAAKTTKDAVASLANARASATDATGSS